MGNVCLMPAAATGTAEILLLSAAMVGVALAWRNLRDRRAEAEPDTVVAA